MKRLIATIIALAMLLALVPIPAEASVNIAPDERPTAWTCTWYRVKWGDTLSSLAVRYGTTVRAIMNANRLRSTRIYVGQRLCIPTNAPPPKPNSGPWFAQYWNNTNQSGSPALVRTQSQVSANWGFGSPNLQYVQPDNFSGRFTRQMWFESGTYRFTFNVDDGVRLWIGNNVVLDNMSVGAKTVSVDVPVPGGWVPVRIDYAEYTGHAFIEFSFLRLGPAPWPPHPGPWPPPPCPGCWGGPWAGAYFNNTSLAGPPTYVATYPKLEFNWGFGSPSPAVPPTHYSARYQCWCNFAQGTYRFIAKVDDGVRVYVDGNKVIDKWQEQSANIFTSVDIPLSAGPHNIVVEYVQYGGNSLLTFYWITLPIGTIVPGS